MASFIIMCPPFVTGGPEAMHQLCHILNSSGHDASMYYYLPTPGTPFIKLDCHTTATPEPYQHYCIRVSDCPTVDSIVRSGSMLIVPEIMDLSDIPQQLHGRAIYWMLSVNGNLEPISRHGLYVGCQSELALAKARASLSEQTRRIFKLTDYTRDSFIHSESYLSEHIDEKSDQVIYFPSKGGNHADEIIRRMPDIRFVPIQNMTPLEVLQLGLSSKVYIDFGPHYGKDRVPREMASAGCVVITGDENAASSNLDYPLNERKFGMLPSSNHYDYDLVAERIRLDLSNFSAAFSSQLPYREKIREEKAQFTKEALCIASCMLVEEACSSILSFIKAST